MSSTIPPFSSVTESKTCGVDDCENTVPATYSDDYCDEHWYDMEIVE